MAIDILVTTLISTSVYAMLAVGFSLMFGVARIINLAHTAFYTVAGFAIFYFVTSLGLPLWLAVALAIIGVMLVATVSYLFLVDPMREHEATVLLITVALAIILQELMLMAFGGYFRSVPGAVSGYATILGVRVSNQYLLTFAVLVVALVAVWALLMKTRLGLAIRATAQDREVATVMGMNESLIATLTVAIAAGLAGLAGAIVAPLYVLEPHMWLHPLTIVLAISVLGGLGSLKGSILGAGILALTETLVVFLLPLGAFLKGAISLVIMLIVLIIRPEGLFGVAFEEER